MSTSCEHIQTDKKHVIRKLEAFVRVKALEQYCASRSLSLVGLQKHIKQNVPGASMLNQSSCLHLACRNKSISLDIVRFLLELCPDAARQPSRLFHPRRCYPPDEIITTTFPLHLACLNSRCPPSVIELLATTHPAAVRHECIGMYGYVYYCRALPLHHYLSRGSNIDISTIELLVAAYPASLTEMIIVGRANNYAKCTPLHFILHNKIFGRKLDIVQYMVSKEPASVRVANEQGELPLHIACSSSHINLDIIQYLVKVWPESINQQDSNGLFPTHSLCDRDAECDAEIPDIKILALLISASPELVRRSDNVAGMLPIHYAALHGKHEYVKLLAYAYPESLRIVSDEGNAPLHYACMFHNTETVEVICNECPEALCDRTMDGLLAIHLACAGGPPDPELINILLSEDPSLASEKTHDEKPRLALHILCSNEYPDEDVAQGVKLLYDAYPEAIHIISEPEPRQRLRGFNEARFSPLGIAKRAARKAKERQVEWYQVRTSEAVVSFLETQQPYADKIRDFQCMTTLDQCGWLPFHHALQEHASLGTIKIMLKANPCALQVANFQLSFPLHIACEFSTIGVAKYLVELGTKRTLNHIDSNGDSPLHYACRGGNYEVLKYLIEVSAKSVSERNRNGELPIHSICGHKQEDNPESSEYVETTWRLLLAYPEAVMG